MITSHRIRYRHFTLNTQSGNMDPEREQFLSSFSLEDAQRTFDDLVKRSYEQLHSPGYEVYMVTLMDLDTGFILSEKTIRERKTIPNVKKSIVTAD